MPLDKPFITPHHVQYTFLPISLASLIVWNQNGPRRVPAKRIHDSLQGLKGIEDIVDHILCVREGDTYESAVKDHGRNLTALLDRCREKNIKLNPKKLQLRKQEVPYIGHVLTPDGLKPDPSNFKAIVAMPTPSERRPCKGCLEWLRILQNFCLTSLMWRNRWDEY